MPRIRYKVATSVDGYIADRDGGYDWIQHDPDIDFNAIFDDFDTFLVGRRTYEIMTQPGSPPMPPGTRTFVFSRFLTLSLPGVEVVNVVTPEVIERIRGTATRDIWLFGGGELFRSLAAIGAVDTVELSLSPVLLGGGLPLLPGPTDGCALRLFRSRISPEGIVHLHYDVVRPTGEV